MKKLQVLKLRIVLCYVLLNGTLTAVALAWWALLAWHWFRTHEGAATVGLVALGISLNSALITWLTDYVLGWGWDDEGDDWHDPEPVTLPPLKDLMPGGR